MFESFGTSSSLSNFPRCCELESPRSGFYRLTLQHFGVGVFRSGNLLAFCEPFLLRRSALGKQRDSFKQIHGALELRVARADDAKPIFLIQTFHTAGRSFEQNVSLFL